MQRLRFLLPVLVLSAAAVGACSARTAPPPTAAAGTAHDAHRQSDRIAGEYIVTLAAGGNPAAIERTYRDLGIAAVTRLAPDRYLLKLRSDPGPAAIARRARAAAGIKAVQPNFTYRISPPPRRLLPRGG